MELSRDIVKDERFINTYIPNVSGTLQKQPANDSKTAERATAMPGNRDRWSDACDEYICGRSRTFLFHKYRPASEIINISGSANRMAVSTFEPTRDVDIDFRNRRRRGLHTDSNMCSLEVKTTKNLEDLVRDNIDRDQECQKKFNKITTGFRHEIQSSLSPRREHEFDTKSRTVAIRELRRDKRVVPSSVLETRSSDQISCNQYRITRNDTPLRELSPDYETQDSEDVLLNLLKRDHSFHETNTNGLSVYEIDKFSKKYAIIGAYPVLSYNDLVFWIKDHDGVVYIWSRMENSVMLVGHNMKDALMNYLFHQENLRYVNEHTCELVPLDEAEREAEREAEEWIKSCEIVIVTKESIKSLLRGEESKGSRKKKQKKKKNKKN
ncbi:hypothetical protein RhiirA1_541633 [Rhizophagus irregularis]|uniref:PARP catalytic domain-containing protein n=1 Tax=Rhizophagus irregularis TaxID=588596 RepID=A0A2N0R2A2_9GLOM|nr:hypothetical protein RhiirA1_541633 [Rhizophagus irregularis]